MKKLKIISGLLLGVIWGVVVTAQADSPLIIFAAASTTNALSEIVSRFEHRTNIPAKLAFASSSTLAKQIARGAPASVFITAHPIWMDYLAEKRLIVEDSRTVLPGNSLVVIAIKDKLISLKLLPGADFASSFSGRLAMGDPTHVPAGIYGKQAFETLGLWAEIAPRVVNAVDTRAALAYVERGECELGVVYHSDAAASSKVKVVGVFSEESHKPIVFQAAAIAQSDEVRTRRFLAFLNTEEVSEIFLRHGFTRKTSGDGLIK